MGLTTTTAGWFPKSPDLRRARWRCSEEEIDASHPFAAETREDVKRELTGCRRLLGFEGSRSEELAGIVEIFVLEIVELVSGDDLARNRSPGLMVAEDGDLNFAGVDATFHHHSAAVAQSLLDGVVEGSGLSDSGDSDG